MPLTAAAPPQAVPVYSGFDYVTVDSVRRRVYAAHTGSRALLIVDADSGNVIGQVRVGPLHGVAVDPDNGHVYTGDGDAHSVSEVDPVTMKVVRSVDVDGTIDAVAYDAKTHRILADEDDGTRMFIVDSRTFKSLGSVKLPGHKPEYLAVDPATSAVFQNIATDNEFVIVDTGTMRVTKSVQTPELTGNHPLQYDPGLHQVIVGGANGVFSGYDTAGNKRWQGTYSKGTDQCDLDATKHWLACAGGGDITLFALTASAPPTVLGQVTVGRGMHTLAIDSKTHDVWAVWAGTDGDHVQRFSYKP